MRNVHIHYKRGLGTALRHNQVAYSYSVTITALFGVVTKLDGLPGVGSCFLFILGAGTAFAIINVTVTKGFSERLPREPTEVIALGTTLSFFSMSAAVGLGALVAWPLDAWAAWPLCPLISTVAFVLLAGVEMAVAGYGHEAGGVGGDFDT